MTKTGTAELPAYYSNARPELTQLVDPAGLRILEVGCAAGAMGAALLARGAREVVGLDLFEPALAIARTRLTSVHRADLNALPELPFPEGHFDLITFADVLEHLVDPGAVLKHLRRWLAGDGRILLSIPNVRHESVVLPLIVEGKWEYADWGILDRTHLRFFTRDGVVALLATGGFALDGKMAGVETPTPAYVAKAVELVEALGGDGRRFLEECNVIQFVLFARPTERRLPKAAPALAAVDAPPGASGAAAQDPWAGSRATRVLFVPEVEREGDRWAPVFAAVARDLRGNRDVTLAVALPPPLLAQPPAAIAQLPDKHDLDLLLTERPRTPRGWDALVRGATLLVLTSDQPELAALAAECRVAVQDASDQRRAAASTTRIEQPRP